MGNIYERKYTRIELILLANVTLYNNPNTIFLVRNISLLGMFVSTHLKIVTGTDCIVDLDSNRFDEPLIQGICAKVVRQSDDGVAFQFTRMDIGTYMMLQTKLIYSSPDPLALGAEFSGDCPVKIKDERGVSGFRPPGFNEWC